MLPLYSPLVNKMFGLSIINFFVIFKASNISLSNGDLCEMELWKLFIIGKDLFLTVIRTSVGSLLILDSTFFSNSTVILSLLIIGKQKPPPNCKRSCTLRGILEEDKLTNQLSLSSKTGETGGEKDERSRSNGRGKRQRLKEKFTSLQFGKG